MRPGVPRGALGGVLGLSLGVLRVHGGLLGGSSGRLGVLSLCLGGSLGGLLCVVEFLDLLLGASWGRCGGVV